MLLCGGSDGKIGSEASSGRGGLFGSAFGTATAFAFGPGTGIAFCAGAGAAFCAGAGAAFDSGTVGEYEYDPGAELRDERTATGDPHSAAARLATATLQL